MRLARRCLTTPDLLPSKLVKTRFPLRFASVLMLTTHVLDLKYHKCRNKAIQILNTKIPTDPYKMAIFPVGIPYSLQKPKNPYRRDFSPRVATLHQGKVTTTFSSSTFSLDARKVNFFKSQNIT